MKFIEASFENAPKIKVGMQKAGKPGVIAKKVFTVLPHFPALTQRVLQVSNDECATLWEEKLLG